MPIIQNKLFEAQPDSPAGLVYEPEFITFQDEPRSALRGPARWNFQHNIPPTTALRYSITFRTRRETKLQQQ